MHTIIISLLLYMEIATHVTCVHVTQIIHTGWVDMQYLNSRWHLVLHPRLWQLSLHPHGSARSNATTTTASKVGPNVRTTLFITVGGHCCRRWRRVFHVITATCEHSTLPRIGYKLLWFGACMYTIRLTLIMSKFVYISSVNTYFNRGHISNSRCPWMITRLCHT